MITTRTRLKICCIQTAADVAIALRHGADALGFVSAMPSGPGVADDRVIAELTSQIPAGVSRFLLTTSTSVAELTEQQRKLGADTLQLVSQPLAPEEYAELRRAMPGVRIVQVIHVEGEASVQQATAVAPHVSALLLDSGRPSASIPELGGTGRTHNWSLSARIVDEARRYSTPVYLAGGLNADNVAEAIRAVRPFAVDVCSGLRSDDRLDESKVVRFVAALGETLVSQ